LIKSYSNIKILKNGLKHYKIRYDNKGKINAYTDSDFVSDPNDRKSTSWHNILMGKNHISWYSKKQTTIVTSTTEAECLSIIDYKLNIYFMNKWENKNY